MPRSLTPLLLAAALCLSARADDVVFKSDVALTRVDAQVVDQNGRAITGLQVSDFVLQVNGKPVPIRNFASENMPLDILLLLDVSGSMRPHVERIASAARQALRVLTPKDRVAIMVFDTYARVRLPFRSDQDEVTSALNRLLRSESFNGGTRITDAMVSAAGYLRREARPEARRAVVILTDDQTQDEEDEPRVESALARANAILSFLQAPYELPGAGASVPRRHGTWGSGGGMGIPGGGWPGGGGIGMPGGGGIGLPGHGGYGVDPSHTAGTATIAQDSGGDTMQVEDASSLEDTLARLRQRYTLNFYLPEGIQAGDRAAVRLDLSQEAKLRYMQAEVRYRRVYMNSASSERAGPTVVTRDRQAPDNTIDSTPIEPPVAPTRHKVAVNDDSDPAVNTIPDDSAAPAPQSTPQAPTPPAQKPSGGWPRSNGPN